MNWKVCNFLQFIAFERLPSSRQKSNFIVGWLWIFYHFEVWTALFCSIVFWIQLLTLFIAVFRPVLHFCTGEFWRIKSSWRSSFTFSLKVLKLTKYITRPKNIEQNWPWVEVVSVTIKNKPYWLQEDGSKDVRNRVDDSFDQFLTQCTNCLQL